MNYMEKDSRLANTRESFFDVLATYIFENPYEYTIHASDICLKANRSRMTFNRLYESVGDILKWTEEEVYKGFLDLELDRMDLYITWRKVVLFVVKNRMVFNFELITYRGDLLRRMTSFLWNFFSLSNDISLYEMFYAEVFCLFRIWATSGMKLDKIRPLIFELIKLTTTVVERWGDSIVHP